MWSGHLHFSSEVLVDSSQFLLPQEVLEILEAPIQTLKSLYSSYPPKGRLAETLCSR